MVDTNSNQEFVSMRISGGTLEMLLQLGADPENPHSVEEVLRGVCKMNDDLGWRYIGDGVYAKYDGFGVMLHANSHDQPTDRVYLEPSVMAALEVFFRESAKEKRDANRPSESSAAPNQASKETRG